MNAFIAGGSGAIGRQLVPMLVHAGHRVVAMTRTEQGAAALQAMGATPVVADVFDAARLFDVVQRAEPEVVIHQLTAFGNEQSGASNQRAKAALRWQPAIPSWQTGFEALYSRV